MQNLIIDITNRLTAALAGAADGGTFSQVFTPVRAYRPRRELRELMDLTVTVVPRSLSVVGGTRTARNHDIQVDIAVQRRLADESVAAVDPLMQLVHEILGFVTGLRLIDPPHAVVTEVTNDPIYAVEHMDEMRVFTSVITVGFRVMQ